MLIAPANNAVCYYITRTRGRVLTGTTFRVGLFLPYLKLGFAESRPGQAAMGQFAPADGLGRGDEPEVGP
jgi:hypothetical protein